MVISGEILGYRVYPSGAAQLFVNAEVASSDRVKCIGRVVYTIWQPKGTYDFSTPPRLLGAVCTAFVGRNESAVIKIDCKGGDVK